MLAAGYNLIMFTQKNAYFVEAIVLKSDLVN